MAPCGRTLLVLFGVCFPAAATAGDAPAERVVVLAGGARDLAFADRIRGQVSDLPFEISTVRLAPDDGGEGRRETAERLAAEGGVAAVVWYSEGKVSILRQQSRGMALIERSFSERPRSGGEQEPRPRESGSADLEAAAVVVRFALLQPFDAGAKEGLPSAAPARIPDVPPTLARPRESPRVTAGAVLGWQALRDGLEAPDASLLAEATVSIARFEVGPFGTMGAGRSIVAGGAEGELRRQSIGMVAGVLFVDAPRWRLGARLLIGATSLDLTSRLPGETAQMESRIRFFAGAEARAATVVMVGRVPLQLSLGLGVVVVNAAPALYSGSAVATRLSTVEPRSVLGVGVLFR